MDHNNRITLVEEAQPQYCPQCMEKVNSVHECPFCGSMLAIENKEDQLPVGHVLHDRYMLGSSKGNGGFGIVYIGLDTRLMRKVAVKEYFPVSMAVRGKDCHVLTADFSKKETFERGKENFLSESRILARFHDHDAVVNVLDSFEDNGTAYMIMEFLEGKTLECYVEQKGSVSFTKAYGMLRPVLDALKDIHYQGLIHRDISPQNIMVLKDGTVKLMDFGISEAYFSEDDHVAAVKAGYSPIEQYGRQYGPQGPWTDVYALSAVFYYMITGRHPEGSMKRYAGGQLEKPSGFHADISSHAEAAIFKGMALQYEDRYQSIRELETAFDSRKRVDKKIIGVGAMAAAIGIFLAGRSLFTDHTSTIYVYKDYLSEENHFPERSKMYGSDISLIGNMDESYNDEPYSGNTCIRCEQETKTGDWGGWMFVNSYLPDDETVPVPSDGSSEGQGIDLAGADQLIFYAKGENGGETAEFFVSGFGYDEWGNEVVSFPDSSKKQTLGFMTLTDQWQQYTIDLAGMDLTNTICGFGYAMNGEQSGEGVNVFYLDDICFQGNLKTE